MRSVKLELVRRSQPLTTKSLQTAKAPERRQVAAVCFRILSTGIEFLLVRTRRNRWTFPKGGIQTGLTHAQSAAIEAYEEAGVHGRLEETAFTRYTLRKLRKRGTGEPENSVYAHLCEVFRLGEPEELNRNPTWFSSAKAKRRLAEGRITKNAAELGQVVDRALARIQRFSARTLAGNDPLMDVEFEAAEFYARSPMAPGAKLPPAPPPSRLAPAPRRGKLLELRVIQSDRP